MYIGPFPSDAMSLSLSPGSPSCNIENMKEAGDEATVHYISYLLFPEALLGWQVALIVIGVLLWFLAVGLDIVGVVLLILLAREKCKPRTMPCCAV